MGNSTAISQGVCFPFAGGVCKWAAQRQKLAIADFGTGPDAIQGAAPALSTPVRSRAGGKEANLENDQPPPQLQFGDLSNA